MMENEQPKNFGHGWISGTLSVTLGTIGVGAVLCFHFPQVLTMPELRELYPVPYIRALLHLILVSSFVLGVVSIILRRSKAAGLTGIGLTLAAALMGGSRAYRWRDDRRAVSWIGLVFVKPHYILGVVRTARTIIPEAH